MQRVSSLLKVMYKKFMFSFI